MYKPLSLLLVLLSIQSAQSATSSSTESRYQELCAGCHGAEVASAYRNARSSSDGGVEEVARIIREGRPSRGMPAFGRTLSEQETNALATLLHERTQAATRAGTMVGRTIEAEALRTDRSAGYWIGENASDRFLMYVDRGSHLCYDDVELTGIKSIEYRYAKGEGEPPRRFAIVAFDGRDFDSATRIHLGEKITPLTGGWENFRTERIGLSRQLEGHYRLCFIGLEGGGVFNLDKFTLSDQPGQNDGMTVDFDVLEDETLAAAGHSFRLEKVAEVAGELWSMDFLSDGSIIATQKSGSLWIFKNGERIGPIEGTPKVWFLGQGGLHSVQAHPDHANNGWIYLTYADSAPQGSMTAIVRGRIQGNKWIDEQVVYKSAANFYLKSEAHYGSRLTFVDDYVYFSIGDRGQQDKAQDLANPYGKIHRIFADGRIPNDNPFVDKQTALPTIWSYGHRNPQGLAVHPQTAELWATEHGPRGGDELNRILKGTNYGWPLVTFGTNYDGTIVSTDTHKEGVEPPKLHWTPSIGVSALRFYTGTQFPKWRNQLLVASLARQELRLIRIESNGVMKEEVILQGRGRIRDVNVGPDGNPYVVLNFPNGMIFRLARAEPLPKS
jgi:glucose/arabinose dehydrogenase/cytochrome c553